jgi:hypothetical protein
MAREISLTVRDELRDMAVRLREAITGKSVTIVREVLLRESGETVLDKIDSGHFVFPPKLFCSYVYIITQNCEHGVNTP